MDDKIKSSYRTNSMQPETPSITGIDDSASPDNEKISRFTPGTLGVSDKNDAEIRHTRHTTRSKLGRSWFNEQGRFDEFPEQISNHRNKVVGEIFFRTNHSELNADAKKCLDKLINYYSDKLDENSKVILIFRGHADIRGKSTYNMNLSKQRAEALKKYIDAPLSSFDAYESRVWARGESYKPDTQDSLQWMYSRRVEIVESHLEKIPKPLEDWRNIKILLQLNNLSIGALGASMKKFKGVLVMQPEGIPLDTGYFWSVVTLGGSFTVEDVMLPPLTVGQETMISSGSWNHMKPVPWEAWTNKTDINITQKPSSLDLWIDIHYGGRFKPYRGKCFHQGFNNGTVLRFSSTEQAGANTSVIGNMKFLGKRSQPELQQWRMQTELA